MTRVQFLSASVLVLLALSACGGSDSKATNSTVEGSTPNDAITATTANPGPPPGAELEGIRNLEVGQCFEGTSSPDSSDKAVWVVDCAQAHTYEVYELVDYEGEDSGRGAPYPGVPAVQDWSEQACYGRFEAFVGIRWTVSDLDIRVWWPSEDSWKLNDRNVICTVMATDGDKVVDSQRGVGT